MNRRTLTVVVVAVLVVLLGLAWFLWRRDTEGPPLRLKMVRQTVEQGKAIVAFRIEGRDRRSVQISGAQLIRGDLGVVPFVPHTTGWTPIEPWPIQKSSTHRNEFSVLAPTNAPVWQLAVLVGMESTKLSLSQRLHVKAALWKALRNSGSSIYQATRKSWSSKVSVSNQAVIASQLITNGVPTR